MEEHLIYGTRAVIEAITEDREIERLYIQRGINNPLINELRALLREKEIVYQQVPVEKLNRIASGNHQGVVAYISSVIYRKIEDLLPDIYSAGEVPVLLMLDRVTDVRNFGAIARSALCCGVHALIIPTRGSAQITGDAIKTSAGALHTIPVCRENNLKTTLDYLTESGLQVVACTEKATEYIYDVDLTVPVVIIMGSEENGISQEYLRKTTTKVKIPIVGSIGSFNVSVATGMILYETVRQRLKS
ncbi:MAG: 23S rRNA (guanosine(2251)-2'-O)-methyltransferase RlmB [Bacteroidota bacterium]